MGINPARSSRAIMALVAGAAFLVFGLNNTETAALPSYVVSLGAGPFVASLQNSLFVLIAILLRLPLEGLVTRRGSRFAMIMGAAGYTVPCLLLTGCTELWQIVLLRLAQAFGLALFQPSVAQYLTSTSPASSLGKRLGIVRFATTASLMVGPVTIFPLIGSHGYPLFFGALTLVGACGTVIAITLPRDQPSAAVRRARAASEPPIHPTPHPTSHLPLRRSLPLLACPLLLACGYSVVMNFGQTLSEEMLSGCGDGTLFACLSIGGLTGSLVAGWATDRFGAKRSAAYTIISTAAGLLLMGLGQQAEIVLAGAFICGAGYFGATATLVTAAGLASRDGANTLLARQQSALDAGMIAGGLVAGTMLQGGLSVSAAFLATACAAGAALFAWGMMYPHQTRNR